MHGMEKAIWGISQIFVAVFGSCDTVVSVPV